MFSKLLDQLNKIQALNKISTCHVSLGGWLKYKLDSKKEFNILP